ncbi:MAG: hypothetical protein JWL71_1848 [Acidobacteria bacterium]|nr:hypothetical protein [Acidobacteriota bacterium]
MDNIVVRLGALAIVGSIVLVGGSVGAQQRRTPPRTQAARTPDAIQQRYGVQGSYDGTMLHPDGRRSAAVPVTMEDGRTGEFVIPTDTRRDPHPAYYRDDQTGDLHPVRIDPHVTRQQFVQNPRAVRFQPEPRHTNKQSWESDALLVGGGAGGGALIGAAAGGAKGAGVGAVAGGVAGLIYDLVKNKR